MPTPEQLAAQAALLTKPLGELHSVVWYQNGEDVEDETWNKRERINQILIDTVMDELTYHKVDVGNPHDVTFAQVLSADAVTMIPDSQVGPNMVRQAQLYTATHGLVNALVAAPEIIDEVIDARGLYPDLDSRIGAATASIIVEELFTTGVMIVESWNAVSNPVSFTLTFTSGAHYINGVRYSALPSHTFAPRGSLTTIYLILRDDGTLAEDIITSLDTKTKALVGIATVDASGVQSWTAKPAFVRTDRRAMFYYGVQVVGDVEVHGSVISTNISTLWDLRHKHWEGDCTVTGNTQIWDMPIAWDSANAVNTKVFREGYRVRPTLYTINNALKQITFSGSLVMSPTDWVYIEWEEHNIQPASLGSGFTLGGSLNL